MQQKNKISRLLNRQGKKTQVDMPIPEQKQQQQQPGAVSIRSSLESAGHLTSLMILPEIVEKTKSGSNAKAVANMARKAKKHVKSQMRSTQQARVPTYVDPYTQQTEPTLATLETLRAQRAARESLRT